VTQTDVMKMTSCPKCSLDFGKLLHHLCEGSMITDGRPRGEWRRTPWFLRVLGWKHYYRCIYAHARIGGGWDGWEFRK
jgi:hypothetical protein